VHILLTDSATAEDGQEVWPLYRDVFGDQPSYEAWTEQVWDRHRAQAVGGVTYLRAADNAFWGDQIDVPPALLENQWVELEPGGPLSAELKKLGMDWVGDVIAVSRRTGLPRAVT
jgi:hypothetical protein